GDRGGDSGMTLREGMRDAGEQIRLRRRPAGLRRRRWPQLRERQRQTVFLLPGLLTTGNLLAGFYSIVLTLDGRYQWAALALFFETGDFGRAQLFILALATYLLAFLMISNIRYYSFKDLNFAKRHPFPVLLVAAVGIVIVFAYPQKAMFLILCTYALSGPARRVALPKPEPVPPAVLRDVTRGPSHSGE